MLQKVLQSILRKYFGEFLTGLENVELAFWSGKVHIQEASLKHGRINDILKTHGIPLAIKYSFIGSLDIDVPWNKLNSCPVEIKISDVFIVFKLLKTTDSEHSSPGCDTAKVLLIKDYVNYLFNKSEQAKHEASQDGYLKRLLVKILHNMNVQVEQIHIRIENDLPKLFEEEKGKELGSESKKHLQFSLGFCIEHFDSYTIGEDDKRRFVVVESEESRVRKNIRIKEISVYWQSNKFNLFELQDERKNQSLRGIIFRKEHRLLTIDGNILLEKNAPMAKRNNQAYNRGAQDNQVKVNQVLDYCLSSNISILEAEMNYEQFKKIIILHQQFQDASKLRQLTRMKELPYEEQLELQKNYKAIFLQLQNRDFNAEKSQLKIINSIQRKLLLKWSKQEVIEIMKKRKIEETLKSKNKRGWFGFLYQAAQLDLTDEDFKAIEAEVLQLINQAEQGNQKLKIGASLLLRTIKLKLRQESQSKNLVWQAFQLYMCYQKLQRTNQLIFDLLDFRLLYTDDESKSRSDIFQKQSSKNEQLLTIKYLNEGHSENYHVEMASILVNHEIKVLNFVSEIMKLKKEEQDNSNFAFSKAQEQVVSDVLEQGTGSRVFDMKRNKLGQKQSASAIVLPAKSRNYYVNIKAIQFVIQADPTSTINIYVSSVTVRKQGFKDHLALLHNLNIVYFDSSKSVTAKSTIIDDTTIQVNILEDGRVITSMINSLKVLLDEDELTKIYRCFLDQYRIIKKEKLEREREAKGQGQGGEMKGISSNRNSKKEEPYLSGTLKTVTLFKSVKAYHALLLFDRIILFDSLDEYNTKPTKPVYKLQLSDASVSKQDDMTFKLESKTIREIFTCENELQTDRWVTKIEQRIFQSSSSNRMYDLIDQLNTEGDGAARLQTISNQESSIFMDPEVTKSNVVSLQILFFFVRYRKNEKEKILDLTIRGLVVNMDEDLTKYSRKVYLAHLQLLDSRVNARNDMKVFLRISDQNKSAQNQAQKLQQSMMRPLLVCFQGKKKVHPQYDGQVSLKCKLNRLFVNYNAEICYSIISKLAWTPRAAFPQEIRDLKILEILKEILTKVDPYQQRFAEAVSLPHSHHYQSLESYRAVQMCKVLMHVELKCRKAQINLLNGRTHHWIDCASVDDLHMTIDKAAQAFFFRVTAHNISIDDITGYPQTISNPFTMGEPYRIVGHRADKQERPMVQILYSTFPDNQFVNQQRIGSLFTLNVCDLEIHYQHQPVMRFLDMLSSQIILFIMEPSSLHRFDSSWRGEYRFGAVAYRESDIRKILYESIHPRFNKLSIHSSNCLIHFNSQPGLVSIPIEIDTVTINSHAFQDPSRLTSNVNEISRLKVCHIAMNQLLALPIFQSSVLKSQWVSRLLISAEGIRTSIIATELNYQMYFERVLHSQRTPILTFLNIDKDMKMGASIKHLKFIAPTAVYNLVNRCILHNVSYDDGQDKHFTTNFQFGHLSPPSPMLYQLRIDEFSLLIPDIDDKVLVIQDCELAYRRLASQTKEMQLSGKTLHLFGRDNNDLILPLSYEEGKALEYLIEMHPNGEKRMSVFIQQIDVNYNQRLFALLGAYAVLQPDCYPVARPGDFSDLPLIVCHVYLIDSYIQIMQTDEHVYAVRGNVSFTWTRHQQPNKLTVAYSQRANVENSHYEVHMQAVTLRKYTKEMYSTKTPNYRSLSSPMRIQLNMSNIMKRSGKGTVYEDLVADYNIESLLLKLSYRDILELRKYFGGEPKLEDQKQHSELRKLSGEKEPVRIKTIYESESLLPFSDQSYLKEKEQDFNLQSGHAMEASNGIAFAQPSLDYVPFSQHKFAMRRVSFQLGLSELPVPLLDVYLEDSKLNVEKFGERSVISSLIEIGVTHWNMAIGRWEPILEKTVIDITLRLSPKERYVMVSVSQQILINLSIESLKVLQLIGKDISEGGALPLIDASEKAKGVQVSPYVVTNRTGVSLFINSEATIGVRLRTGEKAHLQSKSMDIVENGLNTICFQLQNEPQTYELDLNIATPIKKTVSYRSQPRQLWIKPVSSVILKEIIISSPHIVHNCTCYPLTFAYFSCQLEINPNQKVALPFNEVNLDKKSFRLDFPHLAGQRQNYPFEYSDMLAGYEHYITYADSQTFNCVVQMDRLTGTIIIQPVYYFRNLLPLDLRLEFAINKPTRNQLVREGVEVGKEKGFYQFGSKDEVAMRAQFKGFNFSAFVPLTSANNHDYSPANIDFVDHRGLTMSILIRVKKQEKMKRVKHMLIYYESVLINETPYPLLVFCNDVLLPGQRIANAPESMSKYVFVNQKLLKFGFAENDPPNSTTVFVNELGNQEIEVEDNNQLYNLTMSILNVCLDVEAELYVKIMRINPRFILLNHTTRPMVFRQKDGTLQSQLEVGSMKDWVWENKDKDTSLEVTLKDNMEIEDEWRFSAPMDLSRIEDTVIVLRTVMSSPYRLLLKLQIFKQGHQTYVVFKEITRQQESYFRIRNEIKLVTLKLHQECPKSKIGLDEYCFFECPSFKEIDFAWEYPSAEHIISVEMVFQGPLRSKFHKSTFSVNLEQINQPLNYSIQNEENEKLDVQIYVQALGMRRTVCIARRKNLREEDQLQLNEQSGNKLGISLTEVGISLIGGKRRSQVLFCSIRKLSVIVMQKQQTRSLTLRVKYLNIDNNSNHNSIYPVLMTPLKYNKTLSKSRPFFVLQLQQNLRQKRLKQIKEMRMCLQPVSIKIHEQVLNKLSEIYSDAQLVGQHQGRASNVELAEIFRSYSPNLQWQQRELAKPNDQVFIQEVEIARLVIQISFSIRPRNSSGNFIVFTILSSFGAAVSNVSESQLTLSRFVRRDITVGHFFQQISQFYLKQFIKGIYKVLGSINIVGNPYVFIKLIGEGVWEIINQPTEGFIKGPIEGAIGIVKGGVYFGRNVIAGTFNSFQAISESCSRGVSFLTMDEKFIQRREKIKIKKSQHVLHGLKYGLYSLYTGCEVAVTGLVRHPREGYENNGMSGAMTGILKGVAGLLTKPISGIFEGISKLSQGIKNTALMFQDGPNSRRSRPPRVFHSTLQYYCEYSKEESELVSLLEQVSTNYLNLQVLFIAIDNLQGIVLTRKYFLQVELEKKKVREIEVEDIESISLREGEVLLSLQKTQLSIQIARAKQLFTTFKELKEL